MKKSIVVFLLIFNASYSQISGCTDSIAKNFNPKATNNDGSCLYETAKTKPLISLKLSDSLKETSGLIKFDNL
ncbi:MAG: T9SS C-terminal target domain-containing protein, partial [Flavobacterium sp.]|nr:T9SS C-terminal target domain-containing protein [Flavobacterium sp.]